MHINDIMKLVSGKRVTRLLVVFVGSCSGYPIINQVVFGSRVTTRLIIGLGSYQTRLCNRVGRVDTNPTRMHELPTQYPTIKHFICVFWSGRNYSLIFF
jgi:hypothetical protein